MNEDADIDTDVTIQPGMRVTIRGDYGLMDPPSWGMGSFAILQEATLSLAYIRLDIAATIDVAAGGSLALADMALLAGQLSWNDRAGATLSLTRVAFDGPSITTGVPCRDKPMPRWASGPDCRDPVACPGGCNEYNDCRPDPDEAFGAMIVPSSAAVASGVIDFWAPEGQVSREHF